MTAGYTHCPICGSKEAYGGSANSLQAKLDKANAEIERLKADFNALQHALVGNTGLSAILEAKRLRAALKEIIDWNESAGFINEPLRIARRAIANEQKTPSEMKHVKRKWLPYDDH